MVASVVVTICLIFTFTFVELQTDESRQDPDPSLQNIDTAYFNSDPQLCKLRYQSTHLVRGS